MTVELFPVTPRLLSSTPSTVKLLSRGRVPPTDPPIPVTPPGCAITLGASTARFSMLPFRVPPPLGRSTECESNELFREDDVVWTRQDPPAAGNATVTSAMGTTGPAGSKTWPRSVPVVRCANADAEKSSAVAVTNSAKTTLLRPLTWYRQALLNVALSQFMCPLHSIGQTQTSHCSAWRNLKQTLSRQSDSP